MMKKYSTPDFEIIALSKEDIITTSLGTESPIIGEGNGSWDW